jgi:hypothetical protein
VNEQQLKTPPSVRALTTRTNATVEAFRVELRNRLEKMSNVARENGASTIYLEQLRGSSEKILAAVGSSIGSGREHCG